VTEEGAGAARTGGRTHRAHRLSGPESDGAAAAGHPDPPPRVGFFTDRPCSRCTCKEWNAVPEGGLRVGAEPARRLREPRVPQYGVGARMRRRVSVVPLPRS
jgi:hypothetical protein